MTSSSYLVTQELILTLVIEASVSVSGDSVPSAILARFEYILSLDTHTQRYSGANAQGQGNDGVDSRQLAIDADIDRDGIRRSRDLRLLRVFFDSGGRGLSLELTTSGRGDDGSLT